MGISVCTKNANPKFKKGKCVITNVGDYQEILPHVMGEES